MGMDEVLYKKKTPYHNELTPSWPMITISNGLTIVATVADNSGSRLAVNGGNGDNSITMVRIFRVNWN